MSLLYSSLLSLDHVYAAFEEQHAADWLACALYRGRFLADSHNFVRCFEIKELFFVAACFLKAVTTRASASFLMNVLTATLNTGTL